MNVIIMTMTIHDDVIITTMTTHDDVIITTMTTHDDDIIVTMTVHDDVIIITKESFLMMSSPKFVEMRQKYLPPQRLQYIGEGWVSESSAGRTASPKTQNPSRHHSQVAMRENKVSGV